MLTDKKDPMYEQISYWIRNFGFELSDFLPMIKTINAVLLVAILVLNMPIIKANEKTNTYRYAKWISLGSTFMWILMVTFFLYIPNFSGKNRS